MSLRVVIDTNVFISAVLFGKEAEKILLLWQKKRITFLVSKQIVSEYIKVLSYPKFRLTKKEIKQLLEGEFFPFIEPIKVRTKVDFIKSDPADNRFLALALDGEAQYIISGDRHLLDLGEWRRINIVTIKEFLQII